MDALLRLAERLCGAHARRTIFEPLIADWQRELAEAQPRGRPAVLGCRIAGGIAFTRSLARCTMSTGGWLPTSRAAQIGAVTFFLTFDAALLLLWAAAWPSGRAGDLRSAQTQILLISQAGVVAASVMLPVLFLMRRDTQSTVKHAVSMLAAGAALTAAIVTVTAGEPLNRYFSTFEAFEREYQRNLANDRAGRATYPQTALRERRGPTTIEQRRADYERFMIERAKQETPRQPATWPQQLRRLQPIVLAVLFGVMGWALAGIGPVTFPRAVLWWTLIFATTLMFGGVPGSLTVVGMPKLPFAYALPIFTAMTIALIIASRRRRQTLGTNR